MKLNKVDKDKLRQKLEEQLKEVPVGQRIHFKDLDKEVLESLLFDTYIEKLNINSGKDVQVKYIVWSGPFLSKIDLSEVSFDDVMWYLDYEPSILFIDSSQNHYNGIKNINLSNTNARIDFSKSFYGKYGNNISKFLDFSKCNFSGVDLSNNTIDRDCFIDECNFSNTNINISLNGNHSIKIYNSDMSGINFSAYTVDELFFTDDEDMFANECNLTNTGLKVKLTPIPSEIIAAHKRLMTLERNSINNEEVKC